jgi:hypothetical protein
MPTYPTPNDSRRIVLEKRPFRKVESTRPAGVTWSRSRQTVQAAEQPRPLREVLQRVLPSGADNPATLKFSQIFGNFYRHLFRVLPRNEFGFLHDAFEEFAIEDWKGFIRSQHRYFSAAVRRKSHWVTANEGAHGAYGRWTDPGSCSARST